MTDRYQDLAHSALGQLVVKNLGLPNPPYLDRWTDGDPLVDGTVLIGAAKKSTLGVKLAPMLANSQIAVATGAEEGAQYKGLVFDATGIDSPAGLLALQEFFTPVLRQLAHSGRVIVLGTPPEDADDLGRSIAQRGLEGFTRSLGKEVGHGSTVQLVYVAAGAGQALPSTLEFLLSAKSAYVSGQVVRIGAHGLSKPGKTSDPAKPLAGKVALVTGASRGLGAAQARTLARDGATVIGLDVPQLGDDLRELMAEIEGGAITLDITKKDAPQRIAKYVKDHHGGLDVLVHNAGITRDKRLRNMKPENFSLVVDISVGAPSRITQALLDEGLINAGGRVVGISSIAGIAGNNGQTNYGLAKAGVIGFIDALSAQVADRGITANAIAPGFIETDMVKTIPIAIREAGRRMNSLQQGGQPVDVAEAIAWLAHPGSAAVTGNVVRVCGQSLLGA